ncbi:hypothetical protein LJC49_06280 [Ruminococcaceae bacterium OttesenSCG-928-I18]|nr:hypothetical protein [Ruminococcaceae bacterium OttesenSCG-928-I18]
MKNLLLDMTARSAEAVANSQPKENGFWPGGCLIWSYEPQMPASMMKSEKNKLDLDEPIAG